MKTAITLIASLAIATPTLAQTQAAMTAQAKAIIAKRMVDPASLQLRNTKLVRTVSPQGRPVEVLCGEYNAKNRMGGFTGFKMFLFEPVEMGGIMSIDLPRGMDFFGLDGRDARQDLSIRLPGESVAEVSDRYERASAYAIEYVRPCFS